MARHSLDNGGRFQAYLISSQSEFRAFRTISFLSALFHKLAPFDRSPSRCSHRLFEPIFQHFPTPPLPPACELISSLFLCLVLVGGGFFPTFAEEILVYYILADLENKVRHLWWPNFLQPKPSLCLPPQQTSAPPRRALGHAKVSASFSS